jgi:hypothetical protein
MPTKGNLYYNQLAQQGDFSWLYNRPSYQMQPLMTDPSYNQQAISDYNWNQGNVAPQYNNAQGNIPQVQQPVAPQQMQGQGLPYTQPNVPQDMFGVVPGNLPGREGIKTKPGPKMGAADYMAIAGGGLTAVGDIVQAFRAPKYDTSVQGGDWSGYDPRHGLGDEIARARGINTDNWITQSTGENALKFAGTGASIGGSIVPGIGHAIGAAAGAIGGALTGFFGGRRKKKKAEEQKQQILTEVANQADQFSDVNIKAKRELQAKRIALQNLV